MMNKLRRTLCQSVGGFLGLLSLGACGQPAAQKSQQIYTEDEQRNMHKFRGIGGCEWFLSSVHELRWIEIRDQGGRVVDSPAGVSQGSSSIFSLSTVPIRLKVNWREQDTNNPIHSGKRNERWSGGKITGNFEIPVADRIPDDLLDDLRRDPRGNLRIKIRLHREGVLLGWEIERRPNPRGFTPNEMREQNIWLASAYSFVGGDFKEARPAHYIWENGAFKDLPSALPTPLSAGDKAILEKYNLMLVEGAIRTSPPTPANNRRVWEKGWYIHPRTNKRIETDY